MIRIADATAVRLALNHHGFTSLPLYGKAPPAFGKNNNVKGLAGWQHLGNVTAAQVYMWQRTWPDACNTGILTGYAPALDLDILDENAAVACEDFVRARFEESGYVPVRIGKAPKRAILFRTIEPFDKITVNLFRAGHEGAGEKIELLANGQQLAAHGIHPETRQPYRWHGSTPWTVDRNDLAYIDAEQAHTLVDDVVALLRAEHGYHTRPSSRAPSNGTTRSIATAGGADWQTLIGNIISGIELHESIRNLAAKLIRTRMHEGAAVNLLRALMEASAIPRDDRWEQRYEDIPRAVSTALRLLEAQRQLAAD